MKRLFAILISLLSLIPAYACTTLLVGKNASDTGHVIVGRNEDDPDAIVRHGYVEGKKREGIVPSESGRACIEDTETYGYYWIELIGPEGGLTAADSFLNENGVFIGSDNCALSKETSRETLADGGIEYNLRRIAAERAKSARDAVDIIIELVETYGYAPSGRTYTVADESEAWMIAITRGKHFIAKRVKDDEVAIIPNHYTIHNIEDGDIHSDDLISYAYDMGWYDGKEEFDFAKAYQKEESYGNEYNTLREKAVASLITGESDSGPDISFSVKPKEKITADIIKKALMIHNVNGDEREDLHSQTPRGVCTATTAESDIFIFSKEPEDTVLLSAFGHPCTLPYIKTMPLTDKAFIDMDDPEYNRLHHLEENYGANSYKDDIWHIMRSFQYIMEEQGLYRKSTWSIAKNLLERLSENDRYTIDDIIAVMERAAMDTITADSSDLNLDEDLTISFRSDKEVDLASIILFQPLGYKEETMMIPVSASISYENRTYSISFDPMELFFQIPYSGEYEFILSGSYMDGERFAGSAIIRNAEL